jgi:hypothetical protein
MLIEISCGTRNDNTKRISAFFSCLFTDACHNEELSVSVRTTVITSQLFSVSECAVSSYVCDVQNYFEYQHI